MVGLGTANFQGGGGDVAYSTPSLELPIELSFLLVLVLYFLEYNMPPANKLQFCLELISCSERLRVLVMGVVLNAYSDITMGHDKLVVHKIECSRVLVASKCVFNIFLWFVVRLAET